MSTFRFKQFQITQNRAAAKVGTDAVLLGAWTPIINEPKRILDIGAGTGVISLMMAQRTQNAEITAVEIDLEAFREAKLNFEASPWGNRLNCLKSDIKTVFFSSYFDLIVSNPPFYTEKTFAPNNRRNVARNTSNLNFSDLIEKVNSLLSPEGVFSVIIPFKEEKTLCELAEKNNLFPIKKTHVRGNENAPIKRSLIAFGREQKKSIPKELIIEVERHIYTQEYKELAKDFYLKF